MKRDSKPSKILLLPPELVPEHSQHICSCANDSALAAGQNLQPERRQTFPPAGPAIAFGERGRSITAPPEGEGWREPHTRMPAYSNAQSRSRRSSASMMDN